MNEIINGRQLSCFESSSGSIYCGDSENGYKVVNEKNNNLLVMATVTVTGLLCLGAFLYLKKANDKTHRVLGVHRDELEQQTRKSTDLQLQLNKHLRHANELSAHTIELDGVDEELDEVSQGLTELDTSMGMVKGNLNEVSAHVKKVSADMEAEVEVLGGSLGDTQRNVDLLNKTLNETTGFLSMMNSGLSTVGANLMASHTALNSRLSRLEAGSAPSAPPPISSAVHHSMYL